MKITRLFLIDFLSKFHLLMLIGICNQGCVYTCDNWSRVLEKKVYGPKIEGIVAAASDSKTSDYMLVSYSLPEDHEPSTIYTYALKLDDGGMPTPFGYNGKCKTLETIAEELPGDQIASINDYKFSKESKLIGKQLNESKLFIPVNASIQGIYTYDVQYPYLEYKKAKSSPNIVCKVYAFWNNFSGNSALNITEKSSLDSCKVAFFPSCQPLSNSDFSWQVAKTIVKTPFMMIADIVITPLYITEGLFLHGKC